MRDLRCIATEGHPATALAGAARPWSHGDTRSVPGVTASALVERHPSKFAVVDRVIRRTEPVPAIPPGVIGTHWRPLTVAVRAGTHDAYLGPLREAEAAGSARTAVLRAIDERSREVGGGA